MPEEKMIGPLTFRQFILLAAGIAPAWAVYKYLPSEHAETISIALVVTTLATIFIKTRDSESFDINKIDEYTEKMALEKGHDKTSAFLEKEIAEISAQIETRRQKGLRDDSMLQRALELIQGARDRIKK